MINTGKRARVDPPGLGGQAAGHARGHLIGRQLGGSGTDPRNVVTLFQRPANSPVMRGFENRVRAAVEAGETVRYTVQPIYRGAEAVPRGVTLTARGSGGFRLDATVLNRGTLGPAVAALDDLRRIAPPPDEPPPRADVAGAETELGVRLPGDYVALVEEWGAGTFNDFISVFAPGHGNPNLDLVHEARGWEWALVEQVKAGERHPFEPRIELGGLLAWGATANGDPCFWQLRAQEPKSWIVAVQEVRGPDWHVFEGGLAEFLVAVLDGREQVVVFPEDLASVEPRFERL